MLFKLTYVSDLLSSTYAVQKPGQYIECAVPFSALQGYPDSRRILNRSFDSCVGQAAPLGQPDSPVQPHMVMSNAFERSVGE